MHLDGVVERPESHRVDSKLITAAPERIHRKLAAALELAATNIRAVAVAEMAGESVGVELEQGQRVEIVERPVAAAGIYAPGGRAAYPSSVLMGCVPARAAAVPRVALATPPEPDGSVGAVTLAAAAIAGVDEVYALGGAHAIAALALGTETIEPVDVVAGPGNAWVTEAKRQLFGSVGVDGLAGPSELAIVAGRERRRRCCAARPPGPGRARPRQSARGDRALRRAARRDCGARRGRRVRASQRCGSAARAGEGAVDQSGARAGGRTRAGTSSVAVQGGRRRGAVARCGLRLRRPGGGTAFGDYAAGSNHVLPTGGAARFAGPLGARAFLRRTSVVSLTRKAAKGLASAVDEIAKAEGLPVHGESARARAGRKTR